MKKVTLKFAPAVINKVQTTVDGGLRMTFDVDASQTKQVAALLLMKQNEEPVEILIQEYGEK